MLLLMVCVFYLMAVLAFAVPVTNAVAQHKGDALYAFLTLLVPAALALGLVLADTIWRTKRLQVMAGLFFGILGGLAIAYVLALAVNLVDDLYFKPTSVATTTEAPARRPRPSAPRDAQNYQPCHVSPDDPHHRAVASRGDQHRRDRHGDAPTTATARPWSG